MSNTTAENPVPAGEPPRIKKRLLIPGILVGLLLLLLIWSAIRGTWSDTAEKNPAASSEGIVTQLYQSPDGRKKVRNAMVIDRPIEDVWAVITDYPNFTQIFTTLSAAKIEKLPDGQHHFSGTATSPFGDWAFDVNVKHEEAADKKVASWDQPGGDVTVNRGSWTLTPAGPGKTLVVYQLETAVKRFPNFVVRNVLLGRQKTVIESVDRWLKKNPK